MPESQRRAAARLNLRAGSWLAAFICAACAHGATAPEARSNLVGGAVSVATGLLEEPIEVESGVWFLGPGPQGIKQSLNVNAADTTNTDQLWTGGGLGLNLTGAGVTVGIWDGGAVRAAHQEFGGRVTVVDPAALNSHATHVAGTIGAAGVNPSARGMANQVLIRSRDFNNDLTEMAADMGNGLIHLSNHSYGFIRGWEALVWDQGVAEDSWIADRSRYTVDPNFGKYDAEARSIDQMLHSNQDVLAVWSAGNDRGQQYLNRLGNGTYVAYFSAGASGPGFYRVSAGLIPPPGPDGPYDILPNGGQTAKNTLVVGAIHDITADPYSAGHVAMSSFSSWGATDDGRLGVDLVANGISLTSSTSSSNTAYSTLSGTSMAAPNATGTLALLRQHITNEKGAPPKSATLKAAAIHTAFDAGNPGPDYTFGWGVLDGAAAATFVTDTGAVAPQDFMLENTYDGILWSMDVISDGSSPLKATLVWQDLPGMSQNSNLSTAILNLPTPALVNDLDLWIQDSIGNTYYPWNLNPGTPSAPAFRTMLNHRDNVEQVLIDAPLAGLYTIFVGNTGGSFLQNYSLLFSGAIAASVTPEPASSVLLAIGLVAFAGKRRNRG